MSQATGNDMDLNPGMPSSADIDALTALYQSGQLAEVVARAELLSERHPQSAWLHDLTAKAHVGLGNLPAAAESFQNAIRLAPGVAEGFHNLGVVLQNLGRLDEAIACYADALRINADSPESYRNLGTLLQRQGDPEKAVVCFEQLVRLRPDDPASHYALGMAYHARQWLPEAAACYRRVLAIVPENAAAHYNLGAVLLLQEDSAGAIASFETALRLKPDFIEAHYILGNAHADAGRIEESIASYDRVLKLDPDHVDTLYNLGTTLQQEGRIDEAISLFRHAVRVRPDAALVHYNLGNALLSLDRLEGAINAFEQAVKHQPEFAEAHYNLGNTLAAIGRINEALARYAEALRLRPDFAEAHNNRGLALERLERMDEAIAAYEAALGSGFALASRNLGAVLQKLNRFEEAIACYERALAIDPEESEIRAQKLLQQAMLCDWDAIAADAGLVLDLGITGIPAAPFALLPFDDDPARNRIRSERFAALDGRPPAVLVGPGARPGERIRIGYFSADFQDHATMYLMARLFELHDRDRFEIHAFSYGPDRDDMMRRRLTNAVDHFHDVRLLGDAAIADLARQARIDIAVDLKGYTLGTRLGIFGSRAAPIQLSWLGYPGTIGNPAIDYIVADRVVIPDDQRRHYAERIVWLPHSYQVNDDRRPIADKPVSRAEWGLPEGSFVFCSFNNSYKIAPDLFDIWMRLLTSVEGSVLWLLSTHERTERNLRAEAAKRGVDPARLIFARHVPQAEHLARQRLADLFLDTFNVNAHTTASDALWAGLPLVTKAGQGFAARVAASVLTAVGLPELITTSAEDYESLALDLATNPEKLAAIRTKLASNRQSEPLFDTALFTKNWESALEQLHARQLAGDDPADLQVG